jgi:hypothetical protein
VLKVDGREVARQTMEHIMQWDEDFDIGADTGTPVDDHAYQVPFRFTASSTSSAQSAETLARGAEKADGDSAEQLVQRVDWRSRAMPRHLR